MKKRKAGLGPLETKLIALVQAKESERIYTGDLQAVLEISEKQERELLSRMARAGYIIRLKRGVYLAPLKMPPGGRWKPNEYVIIDQYMAVMGARYYLSGATAFNYYGLVKQIPSNFTIYNDKVSGTHKIAGVELNLIKTSTTRIAGWKNLEISDEKKVKMATLPRAILDSIYDWKRYKIMPEPYKWIESIVGDEKLVLELVKLTKNYSNMSTRRRIGYILSITSSNKKHANALKKTISKSKSWVALNPESPSRGKTIKDWGIIDNVEKLPT